MFIVETWIGKPTNVKLDLVKQIGNKILIKTFKGFSELTLNEKGNYWSVTNEYSGDKIPEEWSNFIIIDK
jgi:hypothetical protein